MGEGGCSEKGTTFPRFGTSIPLRGEAKRAYFVRTFDILPGPELSHRGIGKNCVIGARARVSRAVYDPAGNFDIAAFSSEGWGAP